MRFFEDTDIHEQKNLETQHKMNCTGTETVVTLCKTLITNHDAENRSI